MPMAQREAVHPCLGQDWGHEFLLVKPPRKSNHGSHDGAASRLRGTAGAGRGALKF